MNMGKNTIFPLDDLHTIHRAPLCNHPPAAVFAVGDRVKTKAETVVGTINSVLVAPPTTSWGRCREHYYYVQFPGLERLMYAESNLVRWEVAI